MSQTYGADAYPASQQHTPSPDPVPKPEAQDQPPPAEGQGQPQPNPVPEKFRRQDGTLDADALLKSYTELERQRGQAQPQQPGQPQPQQPAPTAESEAALDEVIGKYADTFRSSGTLPAEAYAEISAKTGGAITQRWVDRYLQGEVALADRQASEIMATVGGEGEYKKMMAWAAGLPEGERSALEAQIQYALTGTPDQVKVVMRGLHSRWREAVSDPSMVLGDSPSEPNVKPFRSKMEMQEFMSSRAYQMGDPAAHRELDARLKAAKAQGYF